MESFRKELVFKTKERVEFINITDQVEEALAGERDQGGPLLGQCHAYHGQCLY